MEIKEIIELMKAVSDNALTSFELEQGDTKITMKKEKKLTQAVSGVQPVIMQAAQIQEAGTAAEQEMNSNMGGVSSDKIVTCPLVGTFYASPSPDAEDFVKVGDTVKKGQVIGIVEAMKLMNEIECEYDGVIDAILVKNEEVVEYGQPLMRIR